jgi:hypothetical protein
VAQKSSRVRRIREGGAKQLVVRLVKEWIWHASAAPPSEKRPHLHPLAFKGGSGCLRAQSPQRTRSHARSGPPATDRNVRSTSPVIPRGPSGCSAWRACAQPTFHSGEG